MSHDEGRDEIGDGAPIPRQHEDNLRRALQSEVSTVRAAGDGLERIRARTRRHGLRAWYVPTLAGAAALAVVMAVLWGTGVLHTPAGQTIANQPTASNTAPSTPRPSDSAQPSGSPDPTATTTAIPPPTRSLPVYYASAQEVGVDQPATELVLFREYHSLAATDDRRDWVRASLDEMFANTPIDPDYRAGLWPTTAHVLDVTIDEPAKSITVDLGGIADLRTAAPPEGMQAFTAAANAVQQVVYDATAAANADQAFSARDVTILADGAPLGSLWRQAVPASVRRDTTQEATIWVESPTQGTTIGSPVTVSGEAALFEAQGGQWTLANSSGADVASGYFTTVEGGVKGPFAIDLGELTPGTYTITVYDLGGLGLPGRGPVDTKTFTVD